MRSMVMLSESFDGKHRSSVINGFSFCELDMVERIRVTEPIWHLKQTNRAAAVHILLSKPSGAFIVRDVLDNGNIGHVLSVVDQSRTKVKVVHFPIRKSSSGISALHLVGSGRCFLDLPALISFYCSVGECEFPNLLLPKEILEAETYAELLSVVADKSQVQVSLMVEDCCVMGNKLKLSSTSCHHPAQAAATGGINLVNNNTLKAEKDQKALSSSSNSLIVGSEPDFYHHVTTQTDGSLVSSCHSSSLCSGNSSDLNGIVYYKSSLCDKLSDYEDIWTNCSSETSMSLASGLSCTSSDDLSLKDNELFCNDPSFSNRTCDPKGPHRVMSAEEKELLTASRVCFDGEQFYRPDRAKYERNVPNDGDKRFISSGSSTLQPCVCYDGEQSCRSDRTKYKRSVPNDGESFISSGSSTLQPSAQLRPFFNSQILNNCSRPQTWVSESQTARVINKQSNMFTSRQRQRTARKEFLNCQQILPNGNVVRLKERGELNEERSELNETVTTGVFRFDFYETQRHDSHVTDWTDCSTELCPLCYASPGYALPYDALPHGVKRSNIAATCCYDSDDDFPQSQKFVSSLNFVPNRLEQTVVNPAISDSCKFKPRKSQNKASKSSSQISATASIRKPNVERSDSVHVRENSQSFSDTCSLIPVECSDDPAIADDYQLPADALPYEKQTVNRRSRNTFPTSVKVLQPVSQLGTLGRNISCLRSSGFQSLKYADEDKIHGKRRSLKTSFSTVQEMVIRTCDRKFRTLEPWPIVSEREILSPRMVASVRRALQNTNNVEMKWLRNDFLINSETVGFPQLGNGPSSSKHPTLIQRQPSRYDNVDISFPRDTSLPFSPSSSSFRHLYCSNTPYCPKMASIDRTASSSRQTQYCEPWDAFSISHMALGQEDYPLLEGKNEVNPVVTTRHTADKPVASTNCTQFAEQRAGRMSDFSFRAQDFRGVADVEISNCIDKSSRSEFDRKDLSFRGHRRPDVFPQRVNAEENNNYRCTGDETIANKVVRFMLRLSQSMENFFGKMVKNFIECTKCGKERNPRNVACNVRQFMNGMKNFFIHQREENLSHFIETEVRELKSYEFLNWDDILEQALHTCVVQPLYTHIRQLYTSEYKRDHQLLSNVERLKFVHSIAVAKLGIRYTQSLEAAVVDGLDFITTMSRSSSPTTKFDCIQRAVRLVDNQIGKSENPNGSWNSFDSEGVVWALVEMLVRSESAASLQFEVDFTRALIDSAIVTAEGHFHVCLFNCALQLIRRLAEIDSTDFNGVTTQRRTQAILNELLLEISFPDEKCGFLHSIKIPFQKNSVAVDLCNMMASRLGVGSPNAYGLFLVADGSETRLPDNYETAALRSLRSSRGLGPRIIYKRINARFIWPAK